MKQAADKSRPAHGQPPKLFSDVGYLAPLPWRGVPASVEGARIEDS